MNFFEQEKNEIFSIFRRVKNRDFSGNTGQVIKNSVYQFAQNIIFKIGSLFFTIIIARLLLPDKMGLYSLALSTIILLGVFSDLGISDALFTYSSKMIGLGKFSKAKGYAKTLFQWKIILSLVSSVTLLITSYFISEYYYNKPIFFALLIGALYLPVVSFTSFLENLFKTTENFRIPLIKEIIFQTIRLVVAPLTILLFLNSNLTDQGFVIITLFSIVVSYSVSLIFLIWHVKKKVLFLNVKTEKLTFNEKKDLKKFIYPLSTISLAGIFFGYIDTIMLGGIVSPSYIAYYSVAFNLVTSGATIIGFTSTALMPLFSRRKANDLKGIFKKAKNFVILISIFGMIFTYLISYFGIKYIYGVEYLPAVPFLKGFSILILFLPLLGLYNGYFISQGRTKEVAGLLIFSTIANIILNFFWISYGLKVGGEMGALYGALAATILSRFFYLIGFEILKVRKY